MLFFGKIVSHRLAPSIHFAVADPVLPLARMSNKPRFGLEAFKFATYVSVPIFMTVVFAANPENLEAIIKQFKYVVYPPEGPKPPSAKEMRVIVEANRKKKLDSTGERPRGTWLGSAK